MRSPLAIAAGRRDALGGCITVRSTHIRQQTAWKEDVVANKEQKRTSREAKKPKQKKKDDKRPSAKPSAPKA